MLDNLLLKVAALFLATVLWLHATNQQIYDQVLSVALQLEGIPDSLVLVSAVPRKVRVSFRAKGDQILWLSLRKPRAVLSLEDPVVGVNAVELDERIVDIPTGIDILGVDIISPRQLRIQLDNLIQKTLPIQARTSGMPAPGYVRVGDELSLTPRSVTLEGPLGVLDTVDGIQAEPLDISGAKGPVTKELDLLIPRSPYIEVSTRTVRVEARIEKLIRKTIVVTPVLGGVLPEGWILEPSSLSVHLLAPESFKDSLDRIEAAGLLVGVTLPRVHTDSTRIPVSFTPPIWAQQCLLSPEEVLLTKSQPAPKSGAASSNRDATGG